MRFERSLNGNLDESAFFEEPVPTEQGAELWVDLSKLDVVNSTGLRHWIKWCKTHPTTTLKVFLTDCPWNFVVQSSMIPGFFPPQVHLQSIRAYYFCARDKEEKAVLLERKKDYFYAEDSSKGTPEVRLPHVACPKCALAMEPDFDEARLFAFLKS